jgi:hypothetical protein
VFTAEFAGAAQEVIAPSQYLTPLAEFPANRFVLTRLEDRGGTVVWLAWDEVRVFINPAFASRRLPPAMRAPRMPVTSYVEIGDDIALCTGAEAVLSYLRGPEEMLQ